MLFAVANLLNFEVAVLLFDTISTHYERDTEDQGDNGFPRYGRSKDHRTVPAADRDRPRRYQGRGSRSIWYWPGNTTDVTALPHARTA